MDTPSPPSSPKKGRSTPMILLQNFIFLMLLGCIATILGTLFLQTRLIFPATQAIYRDPGIYGWAFETISLEIEGGEKSHAWFIPLEEARGVALFSHGNAGCIADRLESIGLLRKLGFSVLAYDYGGYGKSSGKPCEERCYQDIRAAWRYLTETREIPAKDILIFGRSLGGGVSAQLATEVEAGAVVLESTFLSIPDVARDHFPFRYVHPLIRHCFESKNKVAAINSPLLIIHSPDDTLIPFRHGRGLFERATQPKQFFEIHGDHNEGFVLSMDAYCEAWEQFLGPIMPRP